VGRIVQVKPSLAIWRAYPLGSHHRLVALATSTPGDRATFIYETKYATEMLEAIEAKIGHPSVDNHSRCLAECGRDLTRVPELDGYVR